MKFYFIIIVLFFTTSTSMFCGKEKKMKSGTFAFYLQDHAMSIEQASYYRPPLFYVFNKPIQFYNNKIIWYCYKPANTMYNTVYSAILYKKGLGLQEINHTDIQLTSAQPYIVEKFYDLMPNPYLEGEYRLKIIHQSNILDSIDFTISPQEEYTDAVKSNNIEFLL